MIERRDRPVDVGVLDAPGGEIQNSGGLRFETENDAINYARYLADYGHELFSGKTLSIIECYREQYVYLYVCGLILGDSEDFEFALRIVPNSSNTDEVDLNESPNGIYPYAAEVNIYGQDVLVFGWIRESTKCSEQIIPAPIRLQCAQVISKLFRDATPRPVLRFQLLSKLDFAIPEREMSVSKGLRPDELGGCVNGLIQGTSQVVYKMHRVAFQDIRNCAKNSDFADYLLGMTLLVGETFNFTFLDEGIASRLKLIEFATRESYE
jgi:hypothetical protein